MSSSFGLSPDLRAVDLHIYGITHGHWAVDIALGGEYTAGVNDRQYQIARACADELNPNNGDALAIETPGFLAGTTPSLRLPVGFSEYVDLRSDFHLPPEVKESAGDTLEYLAHHHKINPVGYALGHALLKGVEVHYADVDHLQAAELEAYAIEAEAVRGNLGSWSKYMARDKAERRCREDAMLTRLGHIATDIVKNRGSLPAADGQPPKLAFIAGNTHPFGLNRQLRAQDIPVTMNHNALGRLWHSSLWGFVIESGVKATGTLVGKSQRQTLLRRRRQEVARLNT